MILYIHGFRTTTNSHKSKLLKKQYKKDIFLADHPPQPKKAIKYLEEIIKSKNITAIIASSIGGFYATYLSEKYNLKTILINPSVKPYNTTIRYVGVNTTDNNTKFTWKKKHLSDLKEFKVSSINIENYFVFLQKGDDVLDYEIALKRYNGSRFIIEEDGTHRFEKFERHFDKINRFIDN